MIPQGPLEGDDMANGRVEMAEREVKRQCRTLRISAEQNTSVRISDDSAGFKESKSVFMIEQEQFCALPRTELCEAKVGRDRH